MGVIGSQYFEKPKTDNWFVYENLPLISDGEKASSLGYKTEALFGVDINLPDIKQFNAKIKFIPKENSTSNKIFGFVAEVEVDNLDKKDIPPKYLKEREYDGNVTIDPLEEVTYRVEFKFILKDKDGFELTKLTSKKHFIESGKINIIQDTIQDDISINLIQRTKTIKPFMAVLECISCEE